MWYLNKYMILSVLCFCGLSHGFNQPQDFWGVAFGETLKLEEDQILDHTILPFIQALQSGDVKALQTLVGGKLAVTLEKLLSRNTNYSSFLRDRYGRGLSIDSAIFREKVKKRFTRTEEARDMVDVLLPMKNTRQNNLALTLEKDKNGNWKVVAQKLK